jgi:hypothetical protein
MACLENRSATRQTAKGRKRRPIGAESDCLGVRFVTGQLKKRREDVIAWTSSRRHLSIAGARMTHSVRFGSGRSAMCRSNASRPNPRDSLSSFWRATKSLNSSSWSEIDFWSALFRYSYRAHSRRSLGISKPSVSADRSTGRSSVARKSLSSTRGRGSKARPKDGVIHVAGTLSKAVRRGLGQTRSPAP